MTIDDAAGDGDVAFVFARGLVSAVDLPPDPDRDPDDHGGDGDAGNQGNPHWSPNQSS